MVRCLWDLYRWPQFLQFLFFKFIAFFLCPCYCLSLDGSICINDLFYVCGLRLFIAFCDGTVEQVVAIKAVFFIDRVDADIGVDKTDGALEIL